MSGPKARYTSMIHYTVYSNSQLPNAASNKNARRLLRARLHLFAVSTWSQRPHERQRRHSIRLSDGGIADLLSLRWQRWIEEGHWEVLVRRQRWFKLLLACLHNTRASRELHIFRALNINGLGRVYKVGRCKIGHKK